MFIHIPGRRKHDGCVRALSLSSSVGRNGGLGVSATFDAQLLLADIEWLAKRMFPTMTMRVYDLLLASLDRETAGSCWVYGMAVVRSPRTKVTRIANSRQNLEAMGKPIGNHEGTDDDETIVVVMSI